MTDLLDRLDRVASLPPSGLLTAKEAADYLRVTVATLRDLTRRGDLGCVRLSERNTRWHVDDLDEFVRHARRRAA